MLNVLERRVQVVTLARCFEVGHGGLKMMPGDIELMAIARVAPPLVTVLNSEAGIEVAALILDLADQPNCPIRAFLQLSVRSTRKAVSHSLDPLGKITVLEVIAVVLALLPAGGNQKVVDAPTLLRLRNTVVQRLPRARQNHVNSLVDLRPPEATINRDVPV